MECDAPVSRAAHAVQLIYSGSFHDRYSREEKMQKRKIGRSELQVVPLMFGGTECGVLAFELPLTI